MRASILSLEQGKLLRHFKPEDKISTFTFLNDFSCVESRPEKMIPYINNVNAKKGLKNP